MNGEFETAARRKVQEALAVADTGISEEDASARLRLAIGTEVESHIPALAAALIKAAAAGQMQAVKLLFEVLDQLAERRKSQAVVATRSIAEEWGIEPDWSSDRCIHCARAIGDEGIEG
jgi:hypothetical protein